MLCSLIDSNDKTLDEMTVTLYRSFAVYPAIQQSVLVVESPPASEAMRETETPLFYCSYCLFHSILHPTIGAKKDARSLKEGV